MKSLTMWRSGLRARLLLIGFVPLILLISIVFWTSKELTYLQTSVARDYSARMDLVRLSGQMDSSLNAMGRWIWLTYASMNDPGVKNKFLINARNEIKKFDNVIQEFSSIKKTKDIDDELQKTLSSWKLAKAAATVGLEHFEKEKEEDHEYGKKYILSKSTPLLISITNHIQSIISLVRNNVVEDIALQKIKTQKNINYLIILSAFAILWIFFFTIILATKLVKSFATLSESLTQSSEDVGTTSAHLTSISYQLSQTAVSQASALEQISSSLEEVSAMIGKNTDNTKSSADKSSHATMRSQHGQKVFTNLFVSIKEIDKSNNQIIEQVNISNSKFSEIVKIIKEIESKTNIINQIVFQTKLLSFNASIEAARAGEHGNGFSVVAAEVGKLAEMSGNASTEISQMLTLSIGQVESIVSDSKTKIGQSVEDGKNKVETGIRLAAECKDILSEISNSIQSVSLTAIEISKASEEQSIGVTEILKAVNMLDHASQKNSLTSEQAAKSAKELEEYADTVSKNVNLLMYTLDGNALKISRFPWNDKLVLNVPSMDKQHKGLIEKMDIFFKCMDDSNFNGAKIAFKQLAESTVLHFQSEELFLDSIHYPKLTAHKKIHHDLLDKVSFYGEELEKGKINKYQVADFLKNWLSMHIMGQDQHYSRYFHEKEDSIQN